MPDRTQAPMKISQWRVEEWPGDVLMVIELIGGRKPKTLGPFTKATINEVLAKRRAMAG